MKAKSFISPISLVAPQLKHPILNRKQKTLVSNILDNIIRVSLFHIQCILELLNYTLYIYTYINIMDKTRSNIAMGATRTI